MGRVILYSGWLSQNLCEQIRSFTFVFGDNLLGFGKGGQAVIRDAPNAFGVPTKRKPAMTAGSFFSEGNEDDLDAVLISIERLWDKLEDGETIVIPVTSTGEPSLGLERACLAEKAPTIYAAIQTHVREMCDSYPSESAESEADLLRIKDNL